MVAKAGLYIVSTPIGNLGDITLRAIDALNSSDLILCEDTRVSSKLLAKHGTSSPSMIVYNDSSTEKDRHKILSLIKSGKVISLISDAGTPMVSDPGYKLIKFLIEEGVFVDAIPGVSAPITALTLSKLPSDNFYFGGFLPKTSHQRQTTFSQLKSLKATLIFFESPNRIIEALKDAKEVLGNRLSAVARELTKLHQEILTKSTDDLIKEFEARKNKGEKIRGEIVLLVSKDIDYEQTKESLEKNMEADIRNLLQKSISAKDVTTSIYPIYKDLMHKKEIYSIVNNVKKTLK